FMFTAHSCLYCHYNLSCDTPQKDFNTQDCLCEYNHKRCREGTCETYYDYSRCLIIQYPVCDSKRTTQTDKNCNYKENHERCKDETSGFEKGSEFEKLHLQEYIQFNTRVTRKYVKQHFGNNLHIIMPTFNLQRKQNLDRPYKTNPEDVYDKCLPTKETCIQRSRKQARDRSEEEIADDILVISNNDDYLDQDMTSHDPDNIYDFTTTNKMNKQVFNGRKYAQLLLGKDRILINQKYFLERSVPIIVLCTENTCPFIYNCNTEDDDFLRRFFENAL
ncbi:14790_t:CDS:2, partial [Racocetra persica]